MTLILRRTGRGNWAPLRLQYDQARHFCLPTLLQARVGMRLEIAGVAYRVSKVLP